MSVELIHGDCIALLENIKKRLQESNKKYIIVSDPPFNVGYHYNEYDDTMDEDAYFSMLNFVFGNEPHVIINYPETLHKHSYMIGEFPTKIVSWVYNSNTAKQHRDIAFYGIKPDFKRMGQPFKNPNDKRIREKILQGKMARLYDWWNVNQVKNVSKTHSHPCVMPFTVMKNIIGVLPADHIIIDPFMGSGTTGAACMELGRDFIGIELNEEYFKIATARLSHKQEKLTVLQ